MKKSGWALLLLYLLTGCAGIQLVSEYDEIIDKGIIEFAEQFNAHIKNMGDLAGTTEGTYTANLKTYNALEAKLDVLIFRASTAAQGAGCRLEQKVFDRVQLLLQDNLPMGVMPDRTNESENASSCTERLLLLVKDQLLSIRQIHREADKCGEQALSCLRPATARTASRIANQSIQAVSIVETAKKP